MDEFEFPVDDFEVGTQAIPDIEVFDVVDGLLGELSFDPEYDLIGADPDEDGLWDQLMLDLDSDVNPYVAN